MPTWTPQSLLHPCPAPILDAKSNHLFEYWPWRKKIPSTMPFVGNLIPLELPRLASIRSYTFDFLPDLCFVAPLYPFRYIGSITLTIL